MSASQEELPGLGEADTRSATVRESIGAYLAAQRQLRGISVEELARQTRIPLRSLQRLEAGSFDREIDGFVRGFVRTVAEALGLDPQETLTRTLEEPAGARRGASPRLSPRRLALAGVAVLALVGLGFGIQLVAASVREAGSGAGPASPIVMRRDPVRALAEAQGVGGLAPAPALSLASEATLPALPPATPEPPPAPPVAGP